MSATGVQDEGRLVARVIAGDQAAIGSFTQIAGAAIWPIVVKLVGEGKAAEEAFLDVIAALRAHGFARLARFKGRSTLAAYLVLVARDVLAERSMRAFATAPDVAWARFERYFGPDIRRRIGRYFPRADASAIEDHYQSVSLKLIEDDCRRIRAFRGEGSFAGYIGGIVDNLLLDLLRREAPRRRLPAEVLRMPQLHRAIFMAAVWNDVPMDLDRMIAAVSYTIEPEPDREEVGGAMAALAGVIATHRSAVAPQTISIEDEDAGRAVHNIATQTRSPEEALLEAEDALARQALVDAVKREAAALPSEDRLYLKLFLETPEPLPPREIAMVMALPVNEIYRLRQRMDRWMKKIGAGLQNSPNLSV